MVQTCPTCGQENPDIARFCLACATPLAAAPAPRREERKVVTVLFADLVGFTSRAERLDPEEVRALQAPYWARVRTELERHGGTVEKFIGDAVMALFGAPQAHEDDPERAVRAALAVKDALAEAEDGLQIRIGITTGEALVALGARPAEGEGMASGDVVNTAARLQANAPVNGVLVDEATRRATDSAIVYEPAEPVQAKGKAEPIPVWQAIEARSRFGVDTVQAGAPLVGRRRELDRLADALASARAERRAQLVTLVGVPGIGKSRLVYELARLVDEDTELITWRQGRSLPYGEGVTFWALAEMVKAEAGILETDEAEEAAAKLRAALEAVAPDDADWLEPRLRPLVGVGTRDISTDRAESFLAWRRFLEGLALQHPTVLVFEDLHWAGDDVLDFVDELVDWAGDVPLLVLCTARPELLDRRPGWGGGKANATTISLAPLSDEDTARLMGALLERAVMPAEQQEAMLARAGGNPLYAEQFARMLAERRDGDVFELPETVQGIIAARLDLLSPPEKAELQSAAVLGKVFWLGALTHLENTPTTDLEECLRALERREFIRRERRPSIAGEQEFAFRHLLVRDVAYGQIPRGERAAKHEAAARWIESLSPDRSEDRADLLAHHLSSALEYARATGRPTDDLAPRALKALREAGDRAVALHSFAAAARYHEAALELMPPDDPDHASLLIRCGISLVQLGREEGSDLVERGVSEHVERGELEQAADALAELASTRWWGARPEPFAELLGRAAELLANRGDSRAKARVLSHQGRMLILAGDVAPGEDLAREALAIAERLDLADVASHAFNSIGLARFERDDPQAFADLERSIELAQRGGDPLTVHVALNNLATLLHEVGNLRAGRAAFERVLKHAELFPIPSIVRWADGERALDCWLHGEWQSARSHADAFIASCETMPHYLEPPNRMVRAAHRLAAGDRAGALEDSQRGEEVAREAGDPQVLMPALLFRARVLRETGANAAAEALVDELLASPPSALWHDAWVVQLPALLVSMGRRPTFLDGARELASNAWIDAELAVAAGDWARAAGILEGIGAVGEGAETRRVGAELLLRDARRDEGEALLAPALEFYESVGATARVQAGRALLAASA